MRKLNTFEKDELLRFFLYHMGPEQRNLLMSTYPLHYKMLYPAVSPGVLPLKVKEQVEWMEEHSKDPTPDSRPVL